MKDICYNDLMMKHSKNSKMNQNINSQPISALPSSRANTLQDEKLDKTNLISSSLSGASNFFQKPILDKKQYKPV